MSHFHRPTVTLQALRRGTFKANILGRKENRNITNPWEVTTPFCWGLLLLSVVFPKSVREFESSIYLRLILPYSLKWELLASVKIRPVEQLARRSSRNKQLLVTFHSDCFADEAGWNAGKLIKLEISYLYNHVQLIRCPPTLDDLTNRLTHTHISNVEPLLCSLLWQEETLVTNVNVTAEVT